MIDQPKKWGSIVRPVDRFEAAEDLDGFVVQTRANRVPLKPLVNHDFLHKTLTFWRELHV